MTGKMLYQFRAFWLRVLRVTSFSQTACSLWDRQTDKRTDRSASSQVPSSHQHTDTEPPVFHQSNSLWDTCHCSDMDYFHTVRQPSTNNNQIIYRIIGRLHQS